VSELRRDPFTDRWVVIAEGRGARPNEHAARVPQVMADPSCPFCEGHEDRTPPELAAVRRAGSAPDGPGWTVRAIPNRFPTLGGPAEPASPGPRSRDFEARPADGLHEVIIESPSHSPALPYLSAAHRRILFQFFRDRVRSAEGLPSVAAAILFENWGPESGGTLWHPHAQLAGYPAQPTELESEVRRFASAGTCLLENVTDAEVADGRRVVRNDPTFAVLAPYGSEHPYELLVVPKSHRPSFSAASDAEVDQLSELLPRLLSAIDATSPGASYNWFVHGAGRSTSSLFHWHLHVVPRLVRPDGFEIASGWMVNPVPPELAASRISALLDGGSGASARKP
jgi:UDPglucose--hexose-1-phosphate uridylyltransferase